MKPAVVLLTATIFVICLLMYYANYQGSLPGSGKKSDKILDTRVLEYIRNKNDIEEVVELEYGESNVIVDMDELVRGPLKQDDARILGYIREKKFLLPPTHQDVGYNLKEPEIDPSMGQSAVIKRLFKYKEGGFFVECGALDGETRSNTLSLERDYKWTGLLIEGDPSNHQKVLKKNRKAWTAGCCLAIHPYPHQVLFKPNFNIGKILADKEAGDKPVPAVLSSILVAVQCFPIYTLLKAMNVTSVDYFSLDVEGNELDVLKTIPFNLIEIKVLSVEFIHGPSGAEGLENFMRSKGYRVVDKVTHYNNLANDLIFAREDFIPELELPNKVEVVEYES